LPGLGKTKIDHPAIEFKGPVGAVRKRVTAAVMAQAPRGTTLERRGDDVVVRYPERHGVGGNIPAADVELRFRCGGDDGVVSVTWQVDVSQFERQRKTAFWLWHVLLTMPCAGLLFVEPNVGMLVLLLVAFLSSLPVLHFAKSIEQRFVEDVANDIKSIRDVEALDEDDDEDDRDHDHDHDGTPAALPPAS